MIATTAMFVLCPRELRLLLCNYTNIENTQSQVHTYNILITFQFSLYIQDEPSFQKAAGAPVLVMVFYEALCPDSKYFITKQLLPTYKAAAPIMEVQLVPYGKV